MDGWCGGYPPRQPDYGFDVISEAFQKDTPVICNPTTLRLDIPAFALGCPAKGPSTYLHAGASSQGWPHDQKAEDTFDVPTSPEWRTDTVEAEYRAEFLPTGGVALMRVSTTKINIANFNNFADAQTAAKALNELKGY